MKKQRLSRLASGTLALSLAWLVACAPQPGVVPPLQNQNQNTSAPAHASATLLRQGRPQHPNPNHPRNRRALQQRQPLPAYFVELNAEYQGFSTLALTASYLERKIRTLISKNDGEGLRREIDFARYKHPQLLIDIMLADPELYAAAAAMPEVIAFRQQSAAFDMYMHQLAGENTDPQEFRVNTSLGDHRNKSMAMNAQGQSVVIWEARHLLPPGAHNQHIYGQRYDSQGMPVGPEFQISTQADKENRLGWRSTSVAMNSTGNFVVTWAEYGGSDSSVIYARRYDSQGQALGAEFQVNTETENISWTPSIAMDDVGNFVIGWRSSKTNGSERGIYARRYDNQGQALGAELHVSDDATDNNVAEPNLAMDAGGDFLVAWTNYGHGGSESNILMRRYASNGTAFGAAFQVNTLPEHNSLYYPMIAVDAQGNFAVSWTSYSDDWDDADVFARRYQDNGTPQGAEFQVNSMVEGVQTTAAITMDSDGDFAVAWTGYDENWENPQIYARRYASNASPQGPDFRVNTSTGYEHVYPMVAMDAEGNFKIAWTRYESGWPSNIYAMRYNAAGQPQSAPYHLPEHDVTPEFMVNTYTTNNQSNSDIAMDPDGNFVVVWQSQGQDGSVGSIFAQRYDAQGAAQGDEFQVNTYTTNYQHHPAVAMDATGNFVITWSNSGQNAHFMNKSNIYAQRYNAQGIPQGSEFRVCIGTESSKRSDVAMAANGDFVVTWNGSGPGDPEGIYAQRYDAQGQNQGEAFRVNTYTTNDQLLPAIAMSPEGGFVIAWRSIYGQQGSNQGVFAQRYDAQGVAQGTEFRVNTETQGFHDHPDLAISPAGDFVVTWARQGQDGDHSSVYAQRYNAQGAAQGTEFQVNTETQGFQSNPAIAMSLTGNFVITWGCSQLPQGIYAKRYDALGQQQNGKIRLNTRRNHPSNPAVAMNVQGDFVVTWSGGEIWARMLDSQGQPK